MDDRALSALSNRRPPHRRHVPPTIAFAVSSHGFGHAARVSAIIEALLAREPATRIEIFTAVPPWFFTDWLPASGPPASGPPAAAHLRVHPVHVDVGLAQKSPFAIDLEASVAQVRALVDRAPGLIERLAAHLTAFGADLMVADIAPIALESARRAGVPSVLVENFTWSDIYTGLDPSDDDLTELGQTFEAWTETATLRIQVTPCLGSWPGALEVPVVGRRSRQPASATRAKLGIPIDAEVVLVTMGGIPWRGISDRPSGPEHADPDAPFWIMAADVAAVTTRGNVVLLPHRSGFFHPDLVTASNVVVAKLGYSTLAEVAIAGRALAYVPRPGFPESPMLEAWAQSNLTTARIAPEDFDASSRVPQAIPGVSPGAETVIRGLLNADSGSIGPPHDRRRDNQRDHQDSDALDGARMIAETLLDLVPIR